MERDSFIFYRSFAEGLADLDELTRVHCYDAIIDYALNGIEPSLEGVESAVFKLIKPQIDANNIRYLNGLKGGRPKNQTKTKLKPNHNQTVTNPKPNVNVNENENVNDNENVNVKEKEKSREKTSVFIPPTFQEVNDYCIERNNGVNPQAFIDFYTSKGWLIGKAKMKDWKAAVRTWERRNTTTRITPIDRNKEQVEEFFRRNIGI